MPDLRRREFITLLGSSAAAWPLEAYAQQPTMPVIGFLYPREPQLRTRVVAAVRNGPHDTGFVEGRNAAIQLRFAANGATTSIAIVFSGGTDPVEVGLSANFNRPGGNVPGITALNAELAAKRLSLLHDLLPNAVRFAMLVNPGNPNADPLARDAQAAGLAIGRQIEILAVSTARDIDAAFASLVQKRADALLVSPDPLLDN